MATSILAAGTAAATSSSVTLASGETITLFLVTPAGAISSDVAVSVEYQNSSSGWTALAVMSSPSMPGVTFSGPTVFRVNRPASRFSVGVDRA